MSYLVASYQDQVGHVYFSLDSRVTSAYSMQHIAVVSTLAKISRNENSMRYLVASYQDQVGHVYFSLDSRVTGREFERLGQQLASASS